MNRPPKFKRVAAGDYETEDGRYRLRQLDGGATRAWNVEVADVEIARWVDADPENRSAYDYPDPCPVDGAATKRDALALFAKWWGERERTDEWYTVTYRGTAEMVVWVLADTPESARQRAEDGNYDDASQVEFVRGKPYTMKVRHAPDYKPEETWKN